MKLLIDATKEVKYQNIKRAIGIVGIFIIYFFVVYLVPTPEGLPLEGKKTFSLMICAVVAWVAQLAPLTITTIFFVLIQPAIGTVDLNSAVGNFATPTILFVIASFLLAIAMEVSGLGKRIALKIALMAKGDPNRTLLYMMIATGVISTVISDIPVAAAFLPIASSIIKGNNLRMGCSNMARSLMISIPVAAFIGGVGTPAGCSLNVLTIDTLRNVTEGRVDIQFYQWTAIGILLVIFLIPLSYIVIKKIFPAEIKLLNNTNDLEAEYKALGRINAKEIKFLVILGVCMALWFTESVHKLPIPITTTIGVALYFLPFINILNFKNIDKIPLDVILLIGAGNSLGYALGITGFTNWLGQMISNSFNGASPLVLIIFISLFITVIHLVCPINNAIVSFMVPTLVAVAVGIGANPALLVVPMGFSASSAFLIPLDPVPLVTFSEGYYKMTDYLQQGWIVSILFIIVLVLVFTLLARPLGLA